MASSPRVPLGPLRTPPSRRSPGSPASRHSRTPSEPSPLRNVSFSAADSFPEDAPLPQPKAGLQGRSNFDRRSKIPVDPAEIATLLGLKPTALRSVSSSSHDSDRTVRANSIRNSPRQSPHDSPRRSPRSSTHDSPRGGSPALADKENAENIPPSCYSQPPKRKLSESALSPAQRKQATRRNISSPALNCTTTFPGLPQQPSISTPGATFGEYPSYPLPPLPGWLQDPSVLDVLAQLADEAQDPPSPSSSLASSTWAAILNPSKSPKVGLTTTISPKDVFSSPKDTFSSPLSTCSSLFEEKISKYYSPKKAAAAMDVSPRSSRSHRSLRLMMSPSTPTIPEIDEEDELNPVASNPSLVQQVSHMSPTKHARREATALASPAPGKSWASSFGSPAHTTAQWIIATSQMSHQVEPALSASMAALTLSTVPVDPHFSEGDVTLVCLGDNGYIGLKADSKMIQTYL